MQIKATLRKEIKEKRKKIDNRIDKDFKIYNSFINSQFYKNADTILCYVSLPDEVQTDNIILKALNDKKNVAVPYCIDNDGHMEFYLINSLNDLKLGSFNVREPDINKCKKLTHYNNSVILVPALTFDKNGYRLGYGKGYYDRFLQNYSFISIGLCYNSLIVQNVPTNEFDKSVDYIITDIQIITCNNGGENG